MLSDEFGGDVPGSMEKLLRLPGVARKTANIVLGNSFGVVEGIAVDTHVHRLAYRLGFSDEEDPNKVERDLMALFPRKRWFHLTYLLIEHGRAICKAPRPLCEDCAVNDLCPASRVPTSRRARSGVAPKRR
jgi:endonuclease-3